MKKGYIIGQITITDLEKYKKYASSTQAIVQKFGGKYYLGGGEYCFPLINTLGEIFNRYLHYYSSCFNIIFITYLFQNIRQKK